MARAWPLAKRFALAPGILAASGEGVPETVSIPFAFAGQALPGVERMLAPSIRAWAEAVAECIVSRFPDDAPWRLHVAACYGQANAGQNRCRLVDEAVVEILKRRRRHRLKHRVADPAPVTAAESWLQLLLTGPDAGVVSVAPAPGAHAWRSGLVPWPAGRIPVAEDKTAPSRAFAKLVEAEVRLGQRIGAGQTVVDLGACPGSWTYVAVQRGARVTSVDRSPLREDLMMDEAVTFRQGDAFAFEPAQPVDWLICDVIAAPDRSIGLAIDWVRRGWARRFVVTIKFKGAGEYSKLDRLKAELAPLCAEFRLARLCANRNEACVMGEVSSS